MAQSKNEQPTNSSEPSEALKKMSARKMILRQMRSLDWMGDKEKRQILAKEAKRLYDEAQALGGIDTKEAITLAYCN